jgi:hypothetical protein
MAAHKVTRAAVDMLPKLLLTEEATERSTKFVRGRQST